LQSLPKLIFLYLLANILQYFVILITDEDYQKSRHGIEAIMKVIQSNDTPEGEDNAILDTMELAAILLIPFLKKSADELVNAFGYYVIVRMIKLLLISVISIGKIDTPLLPFSTGKGSQSCYVDTLIHSTNSLSR
jgi:hypothetical protein